MKRILALLTAAVIAAMSLGTLFCAAVDVNRCATFIAYPFKTKITDRYIAEYYKDGEQIVAPETEIYEDAQYFYRVVGWKKMPSADDIRAYYKKPYVVSRSTKVTGDPIDVMKDKDVVYAAYLCREPIICDVLPDRTVDIQDVTALLDVLSGRPAPEGNAGIDLDGDGFGNIVDVAYLLVYLK